MGVFKRVANIGLQATGAKTALDQVKHMASGVKGIAKMGNDALGAVGDMADGGGGGGLRAKGMQFLQNNPNIRSKGLQYLQNNPNVKAKAMQIAQNRGLDVGNLANSNVSSP